MYIYLQLNILIYMMLSLARKTCLVINVFNEYIMCLLFVELFFIIYEN
jgi:hypothetical protein